MTTYTINLDGTQLQPVTNGIDPVWSPNGEQIAYARWEEPRGVWIVDVESGTEWCVFDWSETRYPSWSSDGQEIVFSRQHGTVSSGGGRPSGGRNGGPPTGFGGGSSASGEAWQLGVVDTAGGSFWEPLPNSEIN